jgi:uncharacterized membrane protein
MTKRAFSIYRIIAVAIVSVIVSVSINLGNWYLPVISIIASWLFLYAIRRKVDEVLADERDYMIAGKASSHAIRIYALASVIIGMILYSIGSREGILFSMATTLLYSACFLMLLYAVLFKIYERKDNHD